MKRSVRKRRVKILYVLFLLIVLLVLCAAVPAFYESPGGGSIETAAATPDEAGRKAKTAATEPSSPPATRDEPVSDEHKDEHKLDVDVMFQDELESGCEVYAAVTLLRYYGYDIDEFTFSEEYVPKSPIYYGDDGGYYGPDINSAFAGEPELGYGAYAPVLKKAIDSFLDDEKSDDRAVVEKGLTLAGLCERYILSDNPVMVWVTTDMELPYEYITWTVDYVDENASAEEGDEFSWPVNEHCMLLTGYDSDSFYFADSLEGEIISYDRGQCERVFEELGSQAVVLGRGEKTAG